LAQVSKMAQGPEPQYLELPQQDFTYVAGKTDRPWNHFVGRWQAMQPVLADMLRQCAGDHPRRIIDLGSCTGFFSLQAAYHHPEADVVGIEGSVGIGNGTAGMTGSVSQILATDAVQVHLRWIQHLGLTNCFVAPEVWDFSRVSMLASHDKPICDVLFMLSVVHHIDNISAEQYHSAGLTRSEGVIHLLGKLLRLAPSHFIELPNRPWMECAYDVYQTQQAILEASAKASGLSWRFRGPIFTADWFGLRELWVLEAAEPMSPVDLQSCPFTFLHRGDSKGEDADQDPQAGPDCADDVLLADFGKQDDFAYAAGQKSSKHIQNPLLACPSLGGTPIDPGLMMLQEPLLECVPPGIGKALSAAPTELLLAHLALRDAIAEAKEVLHEVKSHDVADDI